MPSKEEDHCSDVADASIALPLHPSLAADGTLDMKKRQERPLGSPP